jgi:hypothetical protein
MSDITKEDREKIDERCKSCPSGVYASGSGKNKEFYCKELAAKLMEKDNHWFELMDCPRH